MLIDVQTLSERYGLRPKQVRERLALLGRLVEPHVTRGRSNAILLTDAALAIFDRLTQLEHDGYPISAAVQVIQNERSNNNSTNGQANDKQTQNNGHVADLIAELRARIEALEHDKKYLQSKLDTALSSLETSQQQIRALTSGPKSELSSLSRLQALRLAILGR